MLFEISNIENSYNETKEILKYYESKYGSHPRILINGDYLSKCNKLYQSVEWDTEYIGVGILFGCEINLADWVEKGCVVLRDD